MLIERIRTVHRDNYGVLGVRKMWHALYRDGSAEGLVDV
ncbi:IS3 family transposase [Corynebacterium belfantii]